MIVEKKKICAADSNETQRRTGAHWAPKHQQVCRKSDGQIFFFSTCKIGGSKNPYIFYSFKPFIDSIKTLILRVQSDLYKGRTEVWKSVHALALTQFEVVLSISGV